MNLHGLSVTQALKELKSSKAGLSQKEAEKRLIQHGSNILPSPARRGASGIIFTQFKNPLVYFLLIASIVSFYFHNFTDGAVIAGAALIAVVFGFFQEYRADRAFQKIQGYVLRRAVVLRDGEQKEINSADLVLGDVIYLKEGSRVPADARIIEGVNLETDESVLTGEAFAQEKSSEPVEVGTVLADRTSMVYQGTVVVRGKGLAVVVSTGARSEFGRIAGALNEVKNETTPLELKLRKFARLLTVMVVVFALFVFIIGVYRGILWQEIFAVAVAVAVASIPEGLVVMVTSVLAIGMERLLRANALVRNLLAVETLGSTSFICADKTGTVTEGKMSVSNIFTVDDGGAKELALKIAMFASEAYVENPKDNFHRWRLHGEPMEKAILTAAFALGLNTVYSDKKKLFRDELPFESRRQYMSTMVEDGDNPENLLLLYKGAPEILLRNSTLIWRGGMAQKLHLGDANVIKERIEKMNAQGLRTLAVAYRRINKKIDGREIKKFSEIVPDHFRELVFVGIIGFKDALRSGVKDVIGSVREAGVRVVLITGDHRTTARTIAGELGLPSNEENILEGKHLENISQEELEKKAENVFVYARILPHDKLRIVEALQKRGEVVAMTGDGVNDAPALKRADIGVAVGSGTDLAREVADMVILDDNFATITRAVEEGRVIFDNIRKITTYLLVDSFTALILVVGGLILALPLPLTAAQILWINLFADSFPALALAFEPKEDDVMRLKPRKKNEPLLSREMKTIIFAVGIFTDLLLLGIFWWLWNNVGSGSLDMIRTVIFASFGLTTLLGVFALRSLRRSIWEINHLANKYLIYMVSLGLGIMAAGIYFRPLGEVLGTVPISGYGWAIAFLLAMMQIILIESVKKFFAVKRG